METSSLWAEGRPDMNRALKIFKHFRLVFGNPLVDAMVGKDPETMAQVWAQMLAGYSDEEVQAGINAAVDSGKLPNLAAFLTLCRKPRSADSTWNEAKYAGLMSQKITDPLLYWLVQDFGGMNTVLSMACNFAPGVWEVAFNRRSQQQREGKLPPTPQENRMLERFEDKDKCIPMPEHVRQELHRI